jgi:hypothetical protein
MTTRARDVARTTAMQIIALRVCEREYFVARARIFRQRTNPHESRVFELSQFPNAMTIRRSHAIIFSHRVNAMPHQVMLPHMRKFFSQEGGEVAREDGFLIESVRISAK